MFGYCLFYFILFVFSFAFTREDARALMLASSGKSSSHDWEENLLGGSKA